MRDRKDRTVRLVGTILGGAHDRVRDHDIVVTGPVAWVDLSIHLAMTEDTVYQLEDAAPDWKSPFLRAGRRDLTLGLRYLPLADGEEV